MYNVNFPIYSLLIIFPAPFELGHLLNAYSITEARFVIGCIAIVSVQLIAVDSVRYYVTHTMKNIALEQHPRLLA